MANVDEESAVPRSAAAGPEQLVTERERAAWVLTHVDLLPVDQRRAIGLRYWGDCSIREVAVRLGRSEGATKILLHRTLKTLRAQLQADTLLGSPAAASHVA